MWAVGCVFAELWNATPLFSGGNDIAQLFLITQVLGTVGQGEGEGEGEDDDDKKKENKKKKEERKGRKGSKPRRKRMMSTLEFYKRRLPDFGKIHFRKCFESLPFSLVVPNASPEALRLLRSLLCWDPRERAAACEVCMCMKAEAEGQIDRQTEEQEDEKEKEEVGEESEKKKKEEDVVQEKREGEEEEGEGWLGKQYFWHEPPFSDPCLFFEIERDDD